MLFVVFLKPVEGDMTLVVWPSFELSALPSQTLGALNKGPLDDRFEPEVGLMARLDHPHVMRLVGYCNEGKERCLVSPYMINKCLHERLHGSEF